MTLCIQKNGAQCHCQPQEGRFCVYEDALQKAVRNTCQWASDDEGTWHSECGEAFVFNDGSPTDNRMRFCPYCGKSLQQCTYSSR